MIPGQRVSLHQYEPGGGVVTYGRWDPDPHGQFVVPEGLTYSDYSGTLYEQANLEEFMQRFAAQAEVEWFQVHGGYGTRGVIIRFDADGRVPEMGEFFEDIEGGGVVNEDRLAQLEYDAIDEAWGRYGADEFRRKMIKLDPDLEDRFDGVEDDSALLGRLEGAVAQVANESPYVEDAGSVNFGPYHHVIERAIEADPYALEVAFDIAVGGRTARRGADSSPALEQLFEYVGRRYPAFYFALLEYHQTAPGVLGIRPNALEFAEAYAEEVEDPSWVTVAEMMAAELQHLDQGQLEVLADVIEEGDMEKAIDMLERVRR